MYKSGIYQFGTDALQQAANQTGVLSREAKTAVLTHRPASARILNQAPIADSFKLSTFLRIGSKKHPLSRNTFVNKTKNESSYQPHVATSALAAAYVGAFGSDSIYDPQLSIQLAIWKLNQVLDMDLENTYVTGPTGRENSIAQEMTDLINLNWWTREGIANWLASIGF